MHKCRHFPTEGQVQIVYKYLQKKKKKGIIKKTNSNHKHVIKVGIPHTEVSRVLIG